MKIKKPLYIITKDNSLLVREIESEDENTITVKSRFYEDTLITYKKSENIFKTEKEALKFQQSHQQLQKVS